MYFLAYGEVKMNIPKRKLITIGNSEGFTIPIEQRKELDREKFYDLEIEESKEVEGDGSDNL